MELGRWLGASAALALAAGCAGEGGDIPDVPDPIELPSCAGPLAHAIWDAMRPVYRASTVTQARMLSVATVPDSTAYLTGPQIFPKLATLIAAAEREVSMTFYVWEVDTDPSNEILDALAGLQQRRIAASDTSAPIAVRLVVDTSLLGLGGAAPARDFMPVLMASIEARGFDASHLAIEVASTERALTDQFGNTHGKHVVVDGRVAIVMGSNPQYQHDYAEPWFDTAYVFRGDAALAFIDDFDFNWNRSFQWTCGSAITDPEQCQRPTTAVEHTILAPQLGGAAPVCAVMAVTRVPSAFANNDIDNPQDQGFLAAFDAATTVIKMQTPNLNDDAVKAALLRAVLRGVEVRIVASKGFNETAEQPVGGGNEENLSGLYAELVGQGVTDVCDKFRVRWYSHDGIEPVVGNVPFASHAKYTSFDNQLVIVGSANMDTASWNFSQEFNLAVDDAATTAAWDAAVFDANFARGIAFDACAP